MRFKTMFRKLKNRLTDRHLYSLFVALIIFMTGIFAYQAKVSADYRLRLDNQLSRAFDDLTEYVYGIGTSLIKCAATRDNAHLSLLSTDIYAKSSAAAACLGQLPLQDANLENTAKFLSQAGDFSFALSQKGSDTVSEEDRQTMLSLSSYAASLEEGLYDLQQKLYSGALHFSGKKDEAAAFSDGMQTLESRFSDYPALIYDGPFSDHLTDKAPLFLENAPEISEEEAKEKIKLFFPMLSPDRVQSDGEVHATLSAYAFSAFPDETDSSRTLNIQISKKGGMLLQFLDNRMPTERHIEIDEAKNRANRFLEAAGFSSMRDSYYEIRDQIATINFAYTEGNILCYPDLVKVRVALDNGEILGIEAAGYAANHRERAFPAPILSAVDARAALSPVLTCTDVRLALIPKDGGTESLCYECKCTLAGNTLLNFINAETGREEDVLMLLETENGMLTV